MLSYSCRGDAAPSTSTEAGGSGSNGDLPGAATASGSQPHNISMSHGNSPQIFPQNTVQTNNNNDNTPSPDFCFPIPEQIISPSALQPPLLSLPGVAPQQQPTAVLPSSAMPPMNIPTTSNAALPLPTVTTAKGSIGQEQEHQVVVPQQRESATIQRICPEVTAAITAAGANYEPICGPVEQGAREVSNKDCIIRMDGDNEVIHDSLEGKENIDLTQSQGNGSGDPGIDPGDLGIDPGGDITNGNNGSQGDDRDAKMEVDEDERNEGGLKGNIEEEEVVEEEDEAEKELPMTQPTAAEELENSPQDNVIDDEMEEQQGEYAANGQEPPLPIIIPTHQPVANTPNAAALALAATPAPAPGPAVGFAPLPTIIRPPSARNNNNFLSQKDSTSPGSKGRKHTSAPGSNSKSWSGNGNGSGVDYKNGDGGPAGDVTPAGPAALNIHHPTIHNSTIPSPAELPFLHGGAMNTPAMINLAMMPPPPLPPPAAGSSQGADGSAGKKRSHSASQQIREGGTKVLRSTSVARTKRTRFGPEALTTVEPPPAGPPPTAAEVGNDGRDSGGNSAGENENEATQPLSGPSMELGSDGSGGGVSIPDSNGEERNLSGGGGSGGDWKTPLGNFKTPHTGLLPHQLPNNTLTNPLPNQFPSSLAVWGFSSQEAQDPSTAMRKRPFGGSDNAALELAVPGMAQGGMELGPMSHAPLPTIGGGFIGGLTQIAATPSEAVVMSGQQHRLGQTNTTNTAGKYGNTRSYLYPGSSESPEIRVAGAAKGATPYFLSSQYPDSVPPLGMDGLTPGTCASWKGYAAGAAGLNIPSTTGVKDPSMEHRVQYPRQHEAREVREGEEQEHPEMDALIPGAAVGVPIAGVTSGILPGTLNVEESPCKASNQIRQKSP